MAIRKFSFSATTVTATGIGYSPYFSGFIESIEYIKDGSAAYSDGVDMTITADVTGEALLAFGPTRASAAARAVASLNLSETGDLREAAANLFSHLAALDGSGALTIAVEPVPATGLGAAINDRLLRAAAPRDSANASHQLP